MINRIAELSTQNSTSNQRITVQKRDWDKRLELSKANFVKQLNALNVFDSDAKEKMLAAVTQEIRFNCKAFIVEQQLACRDALPQDTPETTLEADNVSELTDVLVGGVLTAVTAVLVNIITTTAPSWIFFTTTTAIAGVVGGALGVSSGVATLGMGAGVGVAGGVAINRYMKRSRAQKIRNIILKQFDTSVMEKLREWGYALIERANAQENL